jgi:acetyl esterase/lipase
LRAKQAARLPRDEKEKSVKFDRLLDPEYAAFLDEPMSRWTLSELLAIRARIDASCKAMDQARGEQRWITSPLDGHSLRLCVYRPARQSAPSLPAMLYIHGGGFVLGRPEMADDYLAGLAQELEILIVAVDYRFAPEHPFPVPLEDCYRALEWIFADSESLQVDPTRVVIMGHSAGGGLAAATAILARDKGEHQLAGLLMVYPMLDHRTGQAQTPDDNPSTGHLSWTREANRFCWQCMQGCYSLDDQRQAHFSPALADDLSGLPASFLSVGALDLFLDEGVAFALQLSRCAVPVELHVYPGVPHMFDQHPGAVTQQSAEDIVRALKKMIE